MVVSRQFPSCAVLQQDLDDVPVLVIVEAVSRNGRPDWSRQIVPPRRLTLRHRRTMVLLWCGRVRRMAATAGLAGGARVVTLF